MRYMEHFEGFLGTGEANAQGEELGPFLEKYNPKKYDNPVNTVDNLILRLTTGEYLGEGRGLTILMIRRKNHPSIGWWALPGGFVELRESLEEAAARELEEETSLTDIPLVQLRTFSRWDRDPRWHIITTTFLSLLTDEKTARAGDDAADALWMDISYEKETLGEGRERCLLTLSSRERDLTLRSEAIRTIEKKSLLTTDDYELVKSEGIAGDHGILIMDALEYLEKLRVR